MDSKHQGPPRRAHSQNLHSTLAKALQEQKSLRQETGADRPAPLPYLGGSTDSCTQAAGSRSPRTSELDRDARRSQASLRPPGEPLRRRVPGASPWGAEPVKPAHLGTPRGARGRASPGEPDGSLLCARAGVELPWRRPWSPNLSCWGGHRAGRHQARS